MNKTISAVEYRARVGGAVFVDGKKQLEVNGPWEAVDKPKRAHEEHDITKAVVSYLEILKQAGKVVVYTHVPQETFTKNWGIKMKNKAMGVRAGVPDMIIVFKYGILFLELKRLKGSVTSEAQKEWIEALNATSGPGGLVLATVVKGFVEAKSIIDKRVIDMNQI
jgi:hypothetical protein